MDSGAWAAVASWAGLAGSAGAATLAWRSQRRAGASAVTAQRTYSEALAAIGSSDVTFVVDKYPGRGRYALRNLGPKKATGIEFVGDPTWGTRNAFIDGHHDHRTELLRGESLPFRQSRPWLREVTVRCEQLDDPVQLPLD